MSQTKGLNFQAEEYHMQNSGIKRLWHVQGIERYSKDSMEGKYEGGKKLDERQAEPDYRDFLLKYFRDFIFHQQAFDNIKVFGTVYLIY